MKYPSAEPPSKRPSRSPLILGLAAIWGLVLIGSLLAALLMRFASVEDASLPYFTYGINGVALVGGGWMSGRTAGEKGWLYGGSAGLLYAVIVIIIGFLAFDAAMRIQPLFFALGAFALGALGGIFGVNTRGT